jgi:hypothetical protein
VSDFAARWSKEGVFFPGGSLIENEFYEDFIKGIGVNTYTIYNYHNIKNYFTIEFDNTLSIQEITATTPIPLVSITGAGTGAKYFSEFGIAITANGNFRSSGPRPVIFLEPKTNRTFLITGTNIKIIPSSREIL